MISHLTVLVLLIALGAVVLTILATIARRLTARA